MLLPRIFYSCNELIYCDTTICHPLNFQHVGQRPTADLGAVVLCPSLSRLESNIKHKQDAHICWYTLFSDLHCNHSAHYSPSDHICSQTSFNKFNEALCARTNAHWRPMVNPIMNHRAGLQGLEEASNEGCVAKLDLSHFGCFSICYIPWVNYGPLMAPCHMLMWSHPQPSLLMGCLSAICHPITGLWLVCTSVAVYLCWPWAV